MNKIYIYGDEAGDILIDDTKFFLITLIASPQPIIGIKDKTYNVHWLIDKIAKNFITPYICYLKPYKGFKDKFLKKFKKMEIMARYFKLIKNYHKYLGDNNKMNCRNYIWWACYQVGFISIIFRIIEKSYFVNGTTIIIDRKTTTSGFKENIKDTFAGIPKILSDSIEKKDHRKLINFSPSAYSLYWSNNNEIKEIRGGLQIADVLAHLSLKQLRLDNNISILDDYGFNNYSMNVTRFLDIPLDESTISEWKFETGLPEPKI
ncbi:MAG: hypothetical protein APR63_13950 [Desulfuromonas sp. SDB]|nr:MAG: hypothetical protein APR63_13950 [Desulfuromonas sp. SDB]